MVASGTIDQVLAFLPKADPRSTIWILTGEQAATWSIAIEDRRSDRIPCWLGLPEDPTLALQQYITANPDQQLRMIVFTPTKRFP